MQGAASAAATVALAIVAALAAPAAWAATVQVRVESSSAEAPLFSGPVTTLPHPVDGGDGSGPHPCHGPPGAPTGATATGALDDAMRGAGISWRGNWDPSFRDFFIDRIGPFASQAPDLYWSLSINGRFSSGGCLAQVAAGDAIRFFYGPLYADPDDPEEGAGAVGDGDQPAIGEAHRRRGGLRRIGAAAQLYLRRAHGLGEEWAALALAVREGRGAPDAAAGLLGPRLHRLRRDGSIDGDVNATAVAVLALLRGRPQRADRAADWLVAAQTPGGGFGYRRGLSADVDSTGLATWALGAAGRRAAAREGAGFIRSAQLATGGFAAGPGGESNSQSTGLALAGLRAAGIDLGGILAPTGLGPTDCIASLSRRDGSISYSAGGPSAAPVWSTAQALLGLTRRAKLLSAFRRSGRARGPR